MGFMDTYKIKKALAVLLSSQNPASPQTVQAISRLKEIGRPALARFVEALGEAKNPEVIEELLTAFLDNETFSFFVNHLAHPNPQVATGIAKVFIKGTKYNPSRLLTLLTDAKTSKAALGKILLQRRDQLSVKSLIALLSAVDHEGRTVLLRLIERSATESMLPDLLRAARSEDVTVRMNVARILARFSTEAVRETLSSLLNDQYKEVRQAALDGLVSLKMPLEMGPVCQMLRDPDPSIQTKSKEILIQAHDPQMARYLAEFLQDEAEEVRRRAVEVLNAVQDNMPVRMLLEALRGKEWWAKVRAFEALRTSGEAKLFDAILTLLQDADEYIRSSAVEILKKDQRTFNYLTETLEDTDPVVRARTIEALVTMNDKRAVSVFLRMLHEVPEMGTLIIPALAKLGDHQALPALVTYVQGSNKTLRIAALRALPPLTDAAHAEQVWKAVMTVGETADDAELKEAVNATANALVGKGVLVRPSTNTTIIQPHPPHPDSHGPASHNDMAAIIHDDMAVITDNYDTDRYIDADMLEPGHMLVDRYRVIRRVGKGGFGAVILVEDTEVCEEIILKFLNREVALDNNMIERFKHELRYARRITHENVIRIHELLTLKKSYAISMEYFLSHSLSDELKQGPLSLKRGIKIVWDICKGIYAAHQVGVVHRDLKPPNILINDSGLVKVVDFGLAAVNDADARLTKTGILLGTPTYMAPEQVRARTIDARTDIYSLGVIMYEVFTGKPPYVADDPMAILFQHVEGNPTPPRQLRADIPPGLEAIILKAMLVDPAKRFQTMDDLRRSIYGLSK
jgi:eukaryotic-like serine/threonine-protein kinase